MKIIYSLAVFAGLACGTGFAQSVTLISQGSSWKYLSNGSNQGTAWQTASFNDALWNVGNAQLGYGDGDEATVLPYGTASNNKYITYYFRQAFTVSNPSALSALTLNIKRDDGAVVYLNGTEIQRTNMPSGTISYTTRASNNINGSGENTFYVSPESASLLVSGNNVLAVEVHQINPSNNDVSFDLFLTATQTAVCGIPSGLNATGITTSSATLNWTAVSGAAGYNIQYRVTGTTVWTTTTSATNSKSVSSLSPGTGYEFQVQTVCSSNTSTFSPSSFFTTLTTPSCAVPAGLSATGITTSSAVLNWGAVSGAISYNIQYRITGTTTWSATSSSTNSKTVTSLASATTYEFQVQTVCSGSTSGFSSLSNFTTLTPPPCPVPGGIYTSAISPTSATLNWSPVSGASAYNVQYRLTGNTSWTTTSSSVSSKSLTGLAPGTNYEYQVQTVCSGNSSAFSVSTFFTTLASGTDTLIPTSALAWKYLDNGSNQGTAWKDPAFNDVAWASGQAELGYGDGDEKTIIGYGPDPNNKYVTTYFRKTFTVNAPFAYQSLNVGVVRDDGIIVYLNGTEVYRNNMPSGSAAYNTLAVTNIVAPDESAWYTASISPSLLVQGTNTIAVEVHQQFLSSADVSFNLRMFASGSQPSNSITRGPYLQMLNTGGVTIRWRSSLASDSRVQYGTSPALGSSTSDFATTTEHVVPVSGLVAGTKYYYSIGTTTQVLQGDTNNNFTTAPVSGSSVPVRVWVTGDFGNGSVSQDNVRNAYMNYSGAYSTNLWLWLGDNAYSNGTDGEYQNYVFNEYPSQLKRFPLFPSPGNHDYAQSGYQSAASLGTSFAYFSNFSVPQSGESGGLASGTPKYYAYNYANVHFISLDSYGALNNAGSAMYNWLNNDLAANTQRWTVVYFHHPPYSQGSHNSNSESELINMRANIIPLLESYHVDLVLSGHSHNNERSYLIKGHFGTSGTFNSSMKVSAATNNFVKTSPYDGTLYAVCGTSGQNPGSIQAGWPMPCMFYADNTNNCSMVLDIEGDVMSGKFLTGGGTVADQFTISKSGARMAYSEPDYLQLGVFYNDAARSLQLNYFLSEDNEVKIELFSITGRRIGVFAGGASRQAKGYYAVEWPLESMPVSTGVHFVRMTAGHEQVTGKVLIAE